MKWINKETLVYLLIIFLLNVHVGNAYRATKIGEAFKLTRKNEKSKRVQNAALKSETMAQNAVEKSGTAKRLEPFTIFCLVVLAVVAISSLVKVVAIHKTREALEGVTENLISLNDLNMNICGEATIQNRILKGAYTMNAIKFMDTREPLAINTIKTTPSLAAKFPPAEIAKAVENITNLTKLDDTLKKLDIETNRVCTYMTKVDGDLLNVDTKLKELNEGSSYPNEFFAFCGNIFNVLNDIRMIVVPVNIKAIEDLSCSDPNNKPVWGDNIMGGLADFKDSNVYNWMNSSTAIIGDGKAMVEKLYEYQDKVVSNHGQAPDNTSNTFLWTVFGYMAKFVWAALSLASMAVGCDAAKKIGQAGAIMEIIAHVLYAIGKIVKYFEDNPREADWATRLEFAEDIIPDFRQIIADLPGALNSDAMAEVCGWIALVLDLIQSLLGIANGVIKLVKVHRLNSEQKEAFKIANKKMILNQCKSNVNYMVKIVQTAKSTASGESFEKTEEFSLAKNKDQAYKICSSSVYTCLNFDTIEMSLSRKRIFTDGDYNNLILGFKIGPISDISVSTTFQQDDEFIKIGYKIATRKMMNMNNVVFCRTCRNNTIIVGICYLTNEHGKEKFKEAKDSGCKIMSHSGITVDNIKDKTDAELANMSLVRREIRITFYYKLVVLEKTIKASTDNNGIMALHKLRIMNNDGKPILCFDNSTHDVCRDQKLTTFKTFHIKYENGIAFYHEAKEKINLTDADIIGNVAKKTFKEKMLKKFNKNSQLYTDPVQYFKNTLCKKYCYNKNPRLGKNDCIMQFGEDRASKKWYDDIKDINDFCKDCDMDDALYNSFDLVDDYQLNAEITRHTFRSPNQKFEFKIDFKATNDNKNAKLQLIDLDYGASPKILINMDICAGKKTKYCTISHQGYIECFEDKKPITSCFKSTKKAVQTDPRPGQPTTTSYYLIVQDYGDVEIIDVKDYEVVWRLSDAAKYNSVAKIRESFLEPGEYVDFYGNSDLVIYNNYKDPKPTPTDTCKFGALKSKFSDLNKFNCLPGKNAAFLSLDSYSDKKTNTIIPFTESNKDLLAASRMVMKSDGILYLLNYKNKKLFNLSKNVTWKTQPTFIPGSRLSLKSGNILTIMKGNAQVTEIPTNIGGAAPAKFSLKPWS